MTLRARGAGQPGVIEAPWDRLTHLCSLSPAPDGLERALRWLAALSEARLEAAMELVRRSGVVELAAANASSSGCAGGPVLGALEGLLARQNARRAAKLRVFPEVLDVVHAAGGHVIKGLGVTPRYAEPGLRHLGDVDAHVATFAQAVRLAVQLRGRGWDWDREELPWVKWDDDVAYGQFNLRWRPPGDAVSPRVDIHAGPYSVGYLGLMPLAGFEPRSVLGRPAMVPCRETALATVAAHAAASCHVQAKDLNDVVALAAGADVDWATVRLLLHEAGAARALDRIGAAGREVFGRSWPAPAGRARRVSLDPAPGLHRSGAIAILAARQERHRASSLLALSRAVGAFRYYSRDLSVRQGGGPAPALDRRARNRWTCWRLVPAADLPPVATAGRSRFVVDEIIPGFVLVTRDGDAAVLLGGEPFVPTVTGRVSAGAVALARRVAVESG
jgi:hypothetical protein